MNGINVESPREEVEYRLKKLKEQMSFLATKRIVVYGTGINTKRVLDCLGALCILGLMDEQYTGKFCYGKKVLSEEEVLLLKADTILIAAEPDSAEAVYKRIFSFCVNNHISILDMYGCDELLMHRNILEQELTYSDLNEIGFKSILSLNEALVVPFRNVLCSEIVSDENRLYEKIEWELKRQNITISNFKRIRTIAQKRVPACFNGSLREVYNVLSVMLGMDETTKNKVQEIEEKITLENLVPRVKMIDLFQEAIRQKKDVYIYSDMLNGERVIDDFMQKRGINGYKKILAKKNMLGSLLGRTLRALSEYYGCRKVLCLGNNVSDNLVIPQLYDVNYQLILRSYDMFLQNTYLQIDREYIENHIKRDEIVEDIVRKYNAPFLQQSEFTLDNDSFAEKVGWIAENGKIQVDLYPIQRWDILDEIERLNFPETDNPLVSIIIPVFNQFEYTYNCLKSILLNSGNVSYEIIVADDSSHDFTSRIEEIVFGITVLHNDNNLLFVRNCNKAAKLARGKYLLFLNNDTQVQMNWLYPLVRIMETREDVGLAGSKLVYPDGSLQEAGGIVWNSANAWNYGNGKNPDSPDYNYVREVDYISGAAIMISKSLWEEIGGFDERFAPAYCEDTDLAFEVRRRGKKVLYQPESVVVHFEGISNGKSIDSGVKKYQKDNQVKFYEKWKDVLQKEHVQEGEDILSAADRKQNRKTVLFVSERIPTYDKDAGSRTIDFYIREFIQRGYIVKFIPDNFAMEEPYTHRLQQMGVEVIGGKYYQKTIKNWLYTNHRSIDYAFLNYPNASLKYVDMLKKLGVLVIYYGHDLHYLRLQREYELFGNDSKAEEAKEYYKKEAYIIKNCDVAYYPSLNEVEVVKKEFNKKNVRQLMSNIFAIDNICNFYSPQKREGIMFVGGYGHTPNIDAVKWFSYNIYPKIYQKIGVPFYIIGADMPVDIRNIEVEGAKILGALTDTELEEIYSKVKMVVVPLRYGAGIKGKVIEAMYYGIPVVTTSIGIEGIPNEEGVVAIANDKDAFADTVIELYSSDDKLKKMSLQGQEVIKRYYTSEAAWNNIAGDFT